MSRELVRTQRRLQITSELRHLGCIFEIANKICHLDYDLRITCILDIECVIQGYSKKIIVSQSPWMRDIDLKNLFSILKSRGLA